MPRFDSALATIAKRILRVVRRVLHVAKISHRILLGRPKIVWIGDSHSTFIAAEQLARPWERSKDGDLVFWLGPQLAFNYRAEVSFRRWRRRLLALSSVQTAVLVLGEIDVRVHLGHDAEKRSAAWVRKYVDEALRTIQLLRLKRAVILGPIPPTRHAPQNKEFPTRGSVESRVEASRWLASELRELCAGNALVFVSLDSLVADSQGCLDSSFERDGCHLNSHGASIVRSKVYRVIAERKAQERV